MSVRFGRLSGVVLIVTLAVPLGCREELSRDGVVSGYVEARDVAVATKIGGTLAELSVDEGDRVTAGQPIAAVDDRDVRLMLDRATAEKGLAEAELRLREAGARAEDVTQAKAELARARAELDGASRDLERMEALLAKGSGTAKLRDDARVRRDATRATVARVTSLVAELEAGSRPEELDAARARVAAVAAQVALAEKQVADTRIESPVDGIVTARVAEAGELLPPGGTIVVVTDMAGAWLTVYVGEPLLPRISLGEKVQVRTDDGQEREGTIRFVASKAEFTPRNVQTHDERVKLVYRVKIGLPNDDGLFKPGMPAEALLDLSGGAS